MKETSLSELYLSFKLITTHYSNLFYHYPKKRGVIYITPIFKLLISSIIYELTIVSKKLFPTFYNFLRTKKKLKKIVKKIVKFDKKKIKYSNQFFIYVYNKYIDKKNPNQRIIYIDITQYRNSPTKSGIQRVIEKIVKELKKISNKNIKISFFYFPSVFPNAYFAEYDLKKKTTLRYFFPKEGDLLFFLDFDIHSLNNNEQLINFLRAKNTKTASMVYDVLPYTNPEWFPVENYKKLYLKWINIILRLDKVFTISKTVKKKLKKNFKTNRNNNIYPIQLGGDFKKIYKVNKKKITDIRFLMVGTLEPRKGHVDIIKAIYFLKKDFNIDVRLDIVGNLGWKYDKILESIEYTNSKGLKVFLHTGVNDKELSEFYSKSSAIIAASYDEGFGLPIMEAFFYKKKVIARNIAVFREVAKNQAFYFPNKSSPRVISKYLYLWIKKKNKSKLKLKKINFISWKRTANQIYHEIKKIN